MIVVATEDFELYHEVVSELRERGVTFTTVEPGDDIPDRTRVVISSESDPVDVDGVEPVLAAPDEVRPAVEEALSLLRGNDGRVIVGVDPGSRPGVAVLDGGTVVAVFQVPLADAVPTIEREVEDAPDPLVRIGDGSRLEGARIVNGLTGVPVELVDETGTTPYLGEGARGMGDVVAAVNIAGIEGDRVDSLAVEPTPGELQVIKNESRRKSADNRSIDEELARRVAAGELTIEEALDVHRNGESEPGDAPDAQGEGKVEELDDGGEGTNDTETDGNLGSELPAGESERRADEK